MNYNAYFQSTKNYVWQWEEAGKVIAVPKDQTIAYVGLVHDILEAIHVQGLPPFGALVLTIIATNPNGKQGIEVVRKIMADLAIMPQEVKESLNFLALLSDVPVEYKTGEKKTLLFQAIFDRCHHILSLKHSRNIFKDFASTRQTSVPETYQTKIYTQPQEFNRETIYKDFRTLQIMGNKFKSVQDILDKMAGFKPIENEILLEENDPQPDLTLDLVEQLVENSKTFHVGSLVKRIWSGLNIPVHSTMPSQQPLGGVSDLTNKGDFDKLLISEFANDDVVFLSRLANNEALYIHREIPPSNNDLKRVILVDASLKNWGTPKTIAFATMLAIARHPKTDIECEAFVIGNSHHPVEIGNINGIISGLEILEGSMNAASGLESFFDEFPPNANREIFLITEPSTLKQSAMLKMANDYQSAINYWIYTDAEGNIDVYKKQQNSKKHLQHLHLPLRELWTKTPQPKIQNPIDYTENTSSLYPILVRGSNDVKALLLSANGDVYQLTVEKTLMKLHTKEGKYGEQSKAWEVIYEDLPFVSMNAEIGILSNGDFVLAVYGPHVKSMCLVNITKNEKKIFPLQKIIPRYGPSYLFKDDQFYFLHFRASSFHPYSIDMNGEVTEIPGFDQGLFEERKREIEEATKESLIYESGNVLRNIKTIFIDHQNYLVLNEHKLWVNNSDQFEINTNGISQRKINAVRESKTSFRFTDGSTIYLAKPGILVLKSSNPELPEIFIPSVVDKSIGVAAENKFAGDTYYLKNGLQVMPVHDFYVNYIATFIRTILNHGT